MLHERIQLREERKGEQEPQHRSSPMFMNEEAEGLTEMPSVTVSSEIPWRKETEDSKTEDMFYHSSERAQLRALHCLPAKRMNVDSYFQ